MIFNCHDFHFISKLHLKRKKKKEKEKEKSVLNTHIYYT